MLMKKNVFKGCKICNALYNSRKMSPHRLPVSTNKPLTLQVAVKT